MNYFDYCQKEKLRSSDELLEIYNCVMGLEKYARSINRFHWEDVLDEALFHVLQNYDSSKGDIENYATKVVRGICINHFKGNTTGFDESFMTDGDAEDEPEEVSLDSIKNKRFYVPGLPLDDVQSDDYMECAKYLAKRYILDYKFFKTKSTVHRKESYSDLFEKFTSKAISKAIEYLNDTYSEKLDAFMKAKESRKGKRCYDDRMEKSRDNVLEYVGSINGIILYRSNANYRNAVKYFYGIDINKFVAEFVAELYSEGGPAVVNVEGTEAYCTLRGFIVFDKFELMDSIEVDVISTLLARAVYKVFKYDKHSRIILSCGKDSLLPSVIEAFGKEIRISMDLCVAKEVSQKGRPHRREKRECRDA